MYLLTDRGAEGALKKGQNQEWPSNEVSESPLPCELTTFESRRVSSVSLSRRVYARLQRCMLGPFQQVPMINIHQIRALMKNVHHAQAVRRSKKQRRAAYIGCANKVVSLSKTRHVSIYGK